MIGDKIITQEFIESLGFKFKETNKMRWWYIIEGVYNRLPCESSYSYWDVILTHDPKVNLIKIEARISNNDTEVFFEGKMEFQEDLKKMLTYHLNIFEK